jgi:rhodanese-related sulfurtransferase
VNVTSELKVRHLELADVKDGLADGSMLVVDVREPHEFALGHIPGSVLLPLSQFDAGLIPMAAGKRIVFSCAAGVRSMQALAIAQGAGLDLCEHYRGGFKDWVSNGQQVKT